MCDLCRHEEAIPGRKLCAVCGEAIARLANAVSAIQARAAQQGPRAATHGHSAEEYKAAFFHS